MTFDSGLFLRFCMKMDGSIRNINKTGAAAGILQLPHCWQQVDNVGDQLQPVIKSLSVLHFGYHHHHHHSILPKGRSFTVNSETKAAVLRKGKSSTANSGKQAAILLGMDRCGSFPLLSAPHSLFSIWTDLKRSEKIPGVWIIFHHNHYDNITLIKLNILNVPTLTASIYCS